VIFTSGDGQWIAVQRGRWVELVAASTEPSAEPQPGPLGKLELETDDTDVAIVGPPNVLVAVTRGAGTKVVLHQPPSLEDVARLELASPMRLAAITGPRFALVSLDGKQVTVVRVASRALSSQSIDTGSPVEFAVGLERSQLLFGMLRKLEVWDAVSGRPLLRLQLQLPPPPRTVGAAQGHLWVTRPGSDEVFIYRLSDGRPFRHHAGAPVEQVVCHPMSPVIVLVTARGLVRLHCLAHSLTVIDAPWQPGMPLAQLVNGDDISLLGGSDGAEPWRVAIGGPGAPVNVEPPSAPVAPSVADKLRAIRAPDAHPAPEPAGFAKVGAPEPIALARTEPVQAARPPRASPHASSPWREPVAVFGAAVVRGVEAEVPVVADDTELGELAQRLGLLPPARRALIVLYAVYLVGEPALSIARLAHVTGDWSEPLGHGELVARALVRRRSGRVSLRAAITDLLDGSAART